MVEATSPVTDSLDQHSIHYVDVAGVRTRYYEAGNGEPLVLIHGGEFGMVCTLDCWSLNLPGLSEHFHVYALDKLGQGYTDNPGRDIDYSIETVIEHILTFLQELHITSAHFVGHSRGALPVAYLAVQHPDLVKSAVLVDTNTTASPENAAAAFRFYTELARRTPPGPPTSESVRLEPEANSYSTVQVTDDLITRLLAIARLPKTQEAQARLDAVRDRVWYASLDRTRAEVVRQIDEQGIQRPVLVVWGFNDPSAPLTNGLQLFERICQKSPRAELHVFNEAGHYSFREHPEKFNRLLRTFCLG
jgi:2-hydroxy-6-oxonona-2,4-dienedioate hydrolase